MSTDSALAGQASIIRAKQLRHSITLQTIVFETLNFPPLGYVLLTCFHSSVNSI